MRNSAVPEGADRGRREFLIQFCQGVSAAFLPARLCRLGPPTLYAADSTDAAFAQHEFHLHPRYRLSRPLDALLLKAQAANDDFVDERFAEQIADILAQWSAGLIETPQGVRAIEEVLSANFLGASLAPTESRVVRPHPVEARHNSFQSATTLGRDAFLRDFKSTLTSLSGILTAEFQVTSINVQSTAAAPSLTLLGTLVRYEIVAAGQGFHREQRVGYWQIDWEQTASGDLRIRRWRATEETQSRSNSPVYVDFAAAALGSNPSYSAQLVHGSDYWRTVLDGACGIDIYGHNGVSVGDIDNDGFDDLYVCQPGGLPNRLYRNRGDGTLEDITETSGVGVIENTSCALFVDIDNDGRQDLIVVRANGPMLFLNEGNGKFRQKANAFQFANPPQGTFTGAAASDYDRDGWLDIYFCLYVYYQGTDQYKYPSPYYDAENGPPNFMMRNNRDGTFRDVTAETGLSKNNTRYSFGCGWNDFNGDGWPDLYVVNDFGRKNLYRNNGNGTFTDVAAALGVEDVGAGMGVCWFDYNDDGVEDLYVADMWTAAGERISMQDVFKKDRSSDTRALYHKHAMGNSLFQNKTQNKTRGGSAVFVDATRAAGIGIGRWAWSSDAWDFDHDGRSDLYVVNGMVSGPSSNPAHDDLNSFFWRQVVDRSPDQAQPSHDYEQGWTAINELIRADGTWSGYERNIFYGNNGDGTFCDSSGAVGLDFLEDGRAFALADFDQDGRQEVFLKNRNGPQLRLLHNVMENLPPSIAFRLRGTKSNRDAVGAVITLITENGRQVRSLQAGSGFLSQHSKDVFFGLGQANGPVGASIRWPSGLVQKVGNLPVNHRVWIEEGSEPSRIQQFKIPTPNHPERSKSDIRVQRVEQLPDICETWLLAPIEAPDFSLLDLAGRTHSFSVLRGRPVLLHCWAAGSDLLESDPLEKEWAGLTAKHSSWNVQGLQMLSLNFDSPAEAANAVALAKKQNLPFPVLLVSEDVAGIYNILYRYIFDRHRDLSLPASFLIDAKGQIVKVYQGPVDPAHVEHDFRNIPQSPGERATRALPFQGVSDTIEFARNYLSYGSIFFQRGYMDQAASSFQIALRDDPTSAEALYGLGSVYLDQQKTTEARDCFERSLKLRASYPDTLANSWNNLGLLAAREGHTGEAIPYFEHALTLSPDHMIAMVNLGSAYRQQKQWDEARKIYERALRVNSNDPEANYGLGMVFAQNDDTAGAFNSLQKALKLRPAYPEALNNLGILYLRTERRDDAVASFEECIRVAPTFEQAYLNLARVYAVEGTPDKARAVLLELLKQHPASEQAQKLMEQLRR